MRNDDKLRTVAQNAASVIPDLEKVSRPFFRVAERIRGIPRRLQAAIFFGVVSTAATSIAVYLSTLPPTLSAILPALAGIGAMTGTSFLAPRTTLEKQAEEFEIHERRRQIKLKEQADRRKDLLRAFDAASSREMHGLCAEIEMALAAEVHRSVAADEEDSDPVHGKSPMWNDPRFVKELIETHYLAKGVQEQLPAPPPSVDQS